MEKSYIKTDNNNTMATVYKVKIELVSPWCSFDEKTIKETVEKALEDENPTV